MGEPQGPSTWPLMPRTDVSAPVAVPDVKRKKKKPAIGANIGKPAPKPMEKPDVKANPMEVITGKRRIK